MSNYCPKCGAYGYRDTTHVCTQNIASGKPTYEQLQQQLAAEREARKKAEENKTSAFNLRLQLCQILDADYMLVDDSKILELATAIVNRAESAEQRIRESQEQEPIHYVDLTRDGLVQKRIHLKSQGIIVYFHPPIPPEVAELQDRIAEPEKDDSFAALIADARQEAQKAMLKFPQPNYVISKIAEESGEVVKEAIHFAEGRSTANAVSGEMKQTIAMLYRLWIEGDQIHGCSAIDAAIAKEESK